MTQPRLVFNPPPGWPAPPPGWVPPSGWKPDPAWPAPPPGWQLWVPADSEARAHDGPGAENEPPVEDATGVQPTTPAGPAAAPPGTGDDARVALLSAEIAALRARLDAVAAGDDSVVLDDDRVLQDVGIYRYHHPLENAVAYRERLDELGGRIADLVRTGGAIEKSNMFTFDNSLAKGRKMTNDLAKLMLRAYNAEADNSIRSLRVGNVVTAKNRLEASRDAIDKLGR